MSRSEGKPLLKDISNNPQILIDDDDRKPPINNQHYPTATTFDGLAKRIEENFQKPIQLQQKMLEMDEKLNVILSRIPVLENRTEDVARLKKELEIERRDRKDNEQRFLKSFDTLMDKIVQLSLKVIILEERLEEKSSNDLMMPQLPPKSEPSVTSSSSMQFPTTPPLCDNGTAEVTKSTVEKNLPRTPAGNKISARAQRLQKRLKMKSVASTNHQHVFRNKSKVHGTNPSVPLACVCGRKYSNPSTLRQHLKFNDHVEKVLPCTLCGMRFTFQSQVKQHKFAAHKNVASRSGGHHEVQKGEDVDAKQANKDTHDQTKEEVFKMATILNEGDQRNQQQPSTDSSTEQEVKAEPSGKNMSLLRLR